MSSEKIKIKTKTVSEMILVLKELEKNLKNDGLEITVNVEQDKDLMSFLCHSKYIEDWDFIKAENNEPKIKIEEEQPKSKGILGDLGIIPGDWNKIGWLIEAIWKTAQKSPAILFRTNFFYEAVKRELESVSQSVGPEHAILTLLVELRYNQHGWDWEEIDEDFTESMKKVWPEMYGKTLTEISKIIYG